MSKRAIYQVTVAGQNISSRLAPLLTSLRIHDAEGVQSDTCEIQIDDRDGTVILPKTGDLMMAALGWEGGGTTDVFRGKVDQVQSSGSRGGGRELRISAKGLDTKGKGKEPQQKSIDNANVKEALEKAGKHAGITSIKVDPEFEKIQREWWGLNDESFIHFGQRVARELGGVFKIQDDRAILARKGGGSVTGQEMPTVTGRWGDNLISWDITPNTSRPRHKRARARWYDRKEGKWKEKEVEIDDPEAEATYGDRYSRADEDEAKGSADNGKADAEREKGGGSAEIDGNASARPGGTFILSGARPGVDGKYRIESVEHDYSRSGWTTRLELKQPQDEAGKDARKPTGGSGASSGGEAGAVQGPTVA